MDRNVSIIVGPNGKKTVLIKDIRFKGRKREDWKEVENYLKEYVGNFTKLRKHQRRYLFPAISRMNMPVRKAGLL